MPERTSGGIGSHAAAMAAVNAPGSRKASGNWSVGISSSGVRYAAIDATLTIAAPSGATA
nr:hypothetical protein CPGR_04131 [Mycolicibacter nonchromogenicus]